MFDMQSSTRVVRNGLYVAAAVAASTGLGLLMLWNSGSRVGVGAVYTVSAVWIAYKCGFGAGVCASLAGDAVLRIVFLPSSATFRLTDPGELIILASMIICCHFASLRGRDVPTLSEVAQRNWAVVSSGVSCARGRVAYVMDTQPLMRAELGVAMAAATLPTAAGAALLWATGSTVGIGGLYVIGVGVAAKCASRRAALAVAIVAIAGVNFFVVPHWQFDWPNSNQIVLYLTFIGLAFLAGQASAVSAKASGGSGGGTKDGLTLANVNGVKYPPAHVDSDPSAYAQDCEIGAMLAHRQINEIVINRTPEALIWRLRDIVRAGKWTGVEVGFSSALARHLARTLPVDRQYDTDDRHVE